MGRAFRNTTLRNKEPKPGENCRLWLQGQAANRGMTIGKNLLGALLSTLAIHGCTVTSLGLGPESPPKTYDLLSPVDNSSGEVARTPFQVLVREPAAIRALAGDRILIKPAPAEIVYFGKAVWSDQLTRLLQARIVETLQNSGRFAAVSDGRARIDVDLELTTSIRKFQIDMLSSGAVASVALHSKIIDQRGGRVIAARGFVAHARADDNSLSASVTALNIAMQDVLPKLSHWIATTNYERYSAKSKELRSQPAQSSPAKPKDKILEQKPKGPRTVPAPSDDLISRRMRG